MISKQRPVDRRLFTYVRYNAELPSEWLGRHGLGHIDPRDVQRLDSTSHMDELHGPTCRATFPPTSWASTPWRGVGVPRGS